MRILIFAGLLAAAALSGCTNTTTIDAPSGGTCSPLAAAAPSGLQQLMLSANQLSVTLGTHYINEITTSVTICQPGTSNCQVIPDLLVDTGSNGLRIFTCVVSPSLNLPSQTVGGNQLAECVTYADHSVHWGPVKLADVTMGGETASNVPVEIIDPTYATIPTGTNGCGGTGYTYERDPSATGYNGIIGVGLLSADCPACASAPDNGMYYSCSGSSCSGVTASTTIQVTNPVAMMATDNNGVVLTLPSVPNSGEVSATGTLTLGVDTEANNGTTGMTTYAASSTLSANPLTFITVWGPGTTNYPAFIDSGSNGLYFPNDGTTFATCLIDGTYWYCPASPPQSASATQEGTSGSPTNSVSFTVTSAQSILSAGNPNLVYATFAGAMNGEFDWGLPFFMGRTVAVGINGKTSVNRGVGPYWAY